MNGHMSAFVNKHATTKNAHNHTCLTQPQCKVVIDTFHQNKSMPKKNTHTHTNRLKLTLFIFLCLLLFVTSLLFPFMIHKAKKKLDKNNVLCFDLTPQPNATTDHPPAPVKCLLQQKTQPNTHTHVPTHHDLTAKVPTHFVCQPFLKSFSPKNSVSPRFQGANPPTCPPPPPPPMKSLCDTLSMPTLTFSKGHHPLDMANID